ncbi:nuclear transport factor 2 family protein [Halalkalicoccus salilacus]|uniref:nuclear transport factor 2 family protein n=1 Tax=Halalkalicoccus salilacus TaxID=3117459 RepID=UPI00300ECDDB
MSTEQEHSKLIERIVEAENSQDADQVAALVAEDYRSETPIHPERNFTGREQVRQNWQAVFENTSDFNAELLRWTVNGDTLWTEWHLTGTQTDGTELDMRGVGIWGVEDGLLQWGRIYMEPVTETGDVTWEEFYTADENSEREL